LAASSSVKGRVGEIANKILFDNAATLFSFDLAAL